MDYDGIIRDLRQISGMRSISLWKRDVCKKAADALEELTSKDKDQMIVTSAISFYDQVETYENCTVEVLTNTKTGDVSYGWWKNEGEEE